MERISIVRQLHGVCIFHFLQLFSLYFSFLLCICENQIDETLGIVAPKKTRRYTIVLSACALTYLVIITSLDMCWWDLYSKANKKMNDKGPINYFPLYIMYTIIIILEIQYSLITYNVCQRFIRLNKCLEGILKTGKVTDHFRKDLGLGKYYNSSFFFSFLCDN